MYHSNVIYEVCIWNVACGFCFGMMHVFAGLLVWLGSIGVCLCSALYDHLDFVVLCWGERYDNVFEAEADKAESALSCLHEIDIH